MWDALVEPWAWRPGNEQKTEPHSASWESEEWIKNQRGIFVQFDGISLDKRE